MDAIATTTPPEVMRLRCQTHALMRAEERGVDIDVGAVVRLEAAIERLRAAWEVPGVDRYWFPIRLPRQRCRVLYDARLRCIVTVVPAPRLG